MRVDDAPTGKPWNNPAAAFERPSATISRFASRCSPRCAEMLRDSAVESANVTNAKPAAGTSSAVRSWRPTAGKAGAGNPEGIGPTTATPSPVKPNTAVAAAAPTTARTIPGTLGHQRRHARITARDATPTTSAGTTVAPSRRPRTNASTSSYTPVAVVVKPNSFGSWLTSTTTAIPLRKPMRTGLENSSARTPIRANPAATQKAPINNARRPASAIARDGSPWAPRSGSNAAAIMGPSAESGPSTRNLDVPKSA